MIKKIFSAATIAAVLAAATAAWAGYKVSPAVYVNSTGRYASGAFGTARNSADSVQYLYCTVSATAGSTRQAQCFAQDASYRFAGCSTSDQAMVLNVASMNSDANVFFTWDASGNCTSIYVDNGSQFEPKK
jgi:hypothetical protein